MMNIDEISQRIENQLSEFKSVKSKIYRVEAYLEMRIKTARTYLFCLIESKDVKLISPIIDILGDIQSVVDQIGDINIPNIYREISIEEMAEHEVEELIF